MSNLVYNNLKLSLANGAVNLNTDTLKILLVTSSYTPNIDTHISLADITNEVVGTGYTAGGQTLQNKTIALDLVNDRAYLTADNPTWSTATITAAGAIVYKNSGVANTSYLITYFDFGGNRTSTGGDFTVAFDSTGILRIQ